MNIKINGNVITIVSNIKFTDLEELGPIMLKDENKKAFYGASASEIPSISRMGASFTYADQNGNACMNIVTDCLQPEELRDAFIHTKQEELEMLLKYEEAVDTVLIAKKASLTALAAMVEVG